MITKKVLKYLHSFSSFVIDFWGTDTIQHSINTGNHQPIRQSPRKIKIEKVSEDPKLIVNRKRKQKNDRVCSNISLHFHDVLVTKKDGIFRLCIENTKLNEITKRYIYFLPRVDDALDSVAGACWFPIIDVISRYFQVEVYPKDREVTTFSTKTALFERNLITFLYAMLQRNLSNSN